jgi:hypothetical protein
MAKGDQLIAQILLGDAPDKRAGRIANDLLREFGRGYPLDRLAKLLENKNEEVVKTGVWIASELGAAAAPFLHKIATFLDHSNPHVRLDAIDSILTCSTRKDEQIIASVILHLDDTHSGVRWKSILFLVQQSEDLLGAALNFFNRNGGYDVHVKGLSLLTSNTDEIRRKAAAYMNDENHVLRKYGVAVAARIAQADSSLLKLALQSQDLELKDFAESVVNIYEINLGDLG